MSIAKFVNEIEVIDPDTKGVVHLSVYKHQSGGGMFAIDSSFLEQVVFDDDNGPGSIPDPFISIGGKPGEPDDVTLYLED